MAPESIIARNLMDTRLATIAGDHPLCEAIARLVTGAENKTVPNALIVVDDDERYEGVLTAKLVLRSLLALWNPTPDANTPPAQIEADLLEVVAGRVNIPVRDALVRGLPVADPDDRILTMIEKVCEMELEFLPVVEKRRAIGLVPITELYYAVARIVLTPGDEGIRLDG